MASGLQNFCGNWQRRAAIFSLLCGAYALGLLFVFHQAALAEGAKDSTTTAGGSTTMDGKASLRLLQGCWSIGNVEVLLCPFGVKVLNKANNLVVIFAKPYTQVHAFNTKTRRAYHTDFAHFVSPYATSMATIKGVTFNELILHKQKALTYKGCSAEQWSLSKEGTERQIALRAQKELVKSAPKTFDLIAATKIPLDKKVVSFLCTYYALPQARGVPMAVEYFTLDNTHHHYLTTQKIATATVTAAELAVPNNYAKSKSLGDLVLTGEPDDGMKLILMDH